MTTKSEHFKKATKLAQNNMEIKAAKKQLELLQQYQKTTNKEERVALLHSMSDPIRSALDSGTSTPNAISHNLRTAIKKDKFRPRNMSIYEFAMNPDLKYISAPFSTFSPELRKKETETPIDEMRATLGHALHNLDNVATQYANDVVQILDATDPEIIKSAINDEISGYAELLTTILLKLDKWYNEAERPKLELYTRVQVINNKTPGGAHTIRIDKQSNKPQHVIKIYIANLRKNLSDAYPNETDATILNKLLFLKVIATFIHEYSHVIDAVSPDRGALGTQISNIAGKIYDTSTEDKYYANAGEISAHKIGDETIMQLLTWLKHRKNKE